jgi:hypothetical protein
MLNGGFLVLIFAAKMRSIQRRYTCVTSDFSRGLVLIVTITMGHSHHGGALEHVTSLKSTHSKEREEKKSVLSF